jgi:hypothetical protein
MLARAFYIFQLLLIGVVTAIPAIFAGTIFAVLTLAPLSFLILWQPKLLLVALPIGSAFAAPIVLGVLPLLANFLRTRPVVMHFTLPLAGAMSGPLSVELSAHLYGSSGYRVFYISAAIAGFVAGLVYAIAYREVIQQSAPSPVVHSPAD